MEFMINVLNNLPDKYDVVLDSLETNLVSTGEDKLTLEDQQEKLNSRFEGFTLKKERRNTMRKHWLRDVEQNVHYNYKCKIEPHHMGRHGD